MSSSVTKALYEQICRWQEELSIHRQMSPHTVKNYHRDVMQFCQFFYEYENRPFDVNDMAQLELTSLHSFLAARRKHAESRSLARSLSALRNFAHYLKENDYRISDAFFQIDSPRLAQKLPRPIETDMIMEMLALARQKKGWQGARNVALLCLLYGGGLRISEALNLNYGDLPPPSRPTLRIIGKGNKPREIPLLAPIVAALENYCEAAPFGFAKDDPLFRSVRGGRLSARQAQIMVEDLRRKLNLPDSVTPHALRHSFATVLLAGGGDLRSIQDLLGHSQLSSTQVYTKIETQQLKTAFAKAHPRA